MYSKKNSLSKSTLIRSIQCAKSLYLYKNNYILRDKPSTAQQQRFNRGHRVGKLAHQLFPNGKDCSFTSTTQINNAITATKLFVQQKTTTIYEAAFKYNGIFVALDILNYDNEKWYAYEVKSSLRISATYLQDATIQYYIMTQCGIEIDDFFIVTINEAYSKTDNFNIEDYFIKTSVLNEIKERIPFIEETIKNAITILDSKTIPNVSIGQQCTKPYPCDFQGHCWTNIPKDAVWYLPGISMQEKSNFVEKGITKINQIEISDELNYKQKIIIQAYQTNEIHIQKEALESFFLPIQYPLYFFDVEVFQPAIPIFNGTKPYQRIPFLYSLHYKENEHSSLQHIDYISPIGSDDREAFLLHFLNTTEAKGSILVFNSLMEKGILNAYATAFPHLQDKIQDRINRIIDIEIPFKELYYYNPKQQGSFSLKAIGNSILGVDEFTKSVIKDGEEAMSIYNELFYLDNSNEIEQQLNLLRKYCQTDTFVLANIVEILKKQF